MRWAASNAARPLAAAFAVGWLAAALPADAATPAERCANAIQSLESDAAGQDHALIESDGAALINAYGCPAGDKQHALRAASRRLTELALTASRAGAPIEETYGRLVAARRVAATWQALIALGDALTASHDYAAATQAYQSAMNDMDDTHADEPGAPEQRMAWARQRANETQMLAPNEQAPPTRGGDLGGLDRDFAGPADRGIKVTPRFLPVTFEFNRAEMTPAGREVAERWAETVRTAKPGSIAVIGHADPRGSDARNDTLSVERAKTLSSFLKANGFPGEIVAYGLGRRCPVRFTADAPYSPEEQLQIMRRVEIVPGTQLPEGYCNGQAAVRAR
jgi:outer membrane protein OmpA-like peptidoglycan-associated protein